MKIVPAFILLFIFSCTQKKEAAVDDTAERTSLLAADRAFSDLSTEKGMKAAFIEYIDSNGVLLRPDEMPIVGANAIDYLISLNDTTYKLNWQPQHAFVSKSADLGYTYGVYAVHPSASDTTLYGTYVSIWKKQADGKWKFLLDTGNEGIGDGQ
jgi:ketosteroid isomerase-like protein